MEPPIRSTLKFAQVALNLGLDKTWIYSVPAPLRDRIEVGQRVRVPFGKSNRSMVGYVTLLQDTCDIDGVKAIGEIVDAQSAIPGELMDLARWMARYYVTPVGVVLDAILPAAVKNNVGFKTVRLVVRGDADETQVGRVLSKQQRVLEAIDKLDNPITPRELARQAGCTVAVIKSLEKKGLVRIEKRRTEEFARELYLPIEDCRPVHLTPEQQIAMQVIKQKITAGGFACVLAHGVTGSGKTELYLRAIADVVETGRQAIVLVPEISLTPQTIRRFRRRFTEVAVLHSNLSDLERHRQWRDIAAGRAQVVVGARSAVFAPCPDLGLIVIDDEHENSFKQDTAPRYSGRDVAVMRAHLLDIPIILGSATPSLETKYNAGALESWTEVHLASRVEGLPMPPVRVVDLRDEARERKGFHAISRALEAGLGEALARGEQGILFLNRRGFSTLIFCARCGYVERCPDCDVGMTYHLRPGEMRCHYCGRKAPPTRTCPSCNVENMNYWGLGTQKLEDEVADKFPGARIARMDSDTTRRRGAHAKILGAFQNGDVDILLGTQMITKGLHFPNVTVVGIINADAALNLPDFRAAERCFQLVSQVAGRAGRGSKPGQVFLQTFNPEHPTIRFAAAHDYDGFFKREMAARRRFGYPPFGRLARIIARGQNPNKVADAIGPVADMLKQASRESRIVILGPVPTPIAKISRHWRYQVLVKAPDARAMMHFMDAVRSKIKSTGDVQFAIDIDPQSTL